MSPLPLSIPPSDEVPLIEISEPRLAGWLLSSPHFDSLKLFTNPR